MFLILCLAMAAWPTVVCTCTFCQIAPVSTLVLANTIRLLTILYDIARPALLPALPAPRHRSASLAPRLTSTTTIPVPSPALPVTTLAALSVSPVLVPVLHALPKLTVSHAPKVTGTALLVLVHVPVVPLPIVPLLPALPVLPLVSLASTLPLPAHPVSPPACTTTISVSLPVPIGITAAGGSVWSAYHHATFVPVRPAASVALTTTSSITHVPPHVPATTSPTRRSYNVHHARPNASHALRPIPVLHALKAVFIQDSAPLAVPQRPYSPKTAVESVSVSLAFIPVVLVQTPPSVSVALTATFSAVAVLCSVQVDTTPVQPTPHAPSVTQLSPIVLIVPPQPAPSALPTTTCSMVAACLSAPLATTPPLSSASCVWRHASLAQIPQPACPAYGPMPSWVQPV